MNKLTSLLILLCLVSCRGDTTNNLGSTATRDWVRDYTTNLPFVSQAVTNSASTVPFLNLTTSGHIITLATNSTKIALNTFSDNNGTGITNLQVLPILRYVYLINDGLDLARMPANVTFTNAQQAYNKANTLGAGTTNVQLNVLVTKATSVGGITLTANWNTNVQVCGISSRLSEIGNLAATNASGNSFTINMTGARIKLGNIYFGRSDTNYSVGTFTYTGLGDSVLGILDGQTPVGNASVAIYGAGTVTSNILADSTGTDTSGDPVPITTGCGQVTIGADVLVQGTINVDNLAGVPTSTAGYVSFGRHAKCLGTISMHHDSAYQSASLYLNGSEIAGVDSSTDLAGVLFYCHDSLVNDQISGAQSINIARSTLRTTSGNKACVTSFSGSGQILGSVFYPNGSGASIEGGGSFTSYATIMQNGYNDCILSAGTVETGLSLTPPFE